jgi:hypothetical protein
MKCKYVAAFFYCFIPSNLFTVIDQEFCGVITENEHLDNNKGSMYTQVPWYAAIATYETGGVTFLFPPSFEYDILPVIQVTAVQQGDITKRVDIRVFNLTPTSVTVCAYNGRGVEYGSDDNIQIHLLIISDYV